MRSRKTNLTNLAERRLDVLIVGGGINGAVAAAALASKGASVGLIDRGDFAGFTSQHTSNLAWGGIKYMENYEFPLVRDLCLSRNALIRSYPSTVREIRFLTTIPRGFRHRPLTMWLGAWAYWLIGNCFTRPPRRLSRRAVEREEPLIEASSGAGFVEYSDAYLHDNDARFVFNFVRTAVDRGATAINYVESLGARFDGHIWRTTARDVESGSEFEIESDILINAAGAFADEHNDLTGAQSAHRHVYSKGVHLLVERMTCERRVLAFFADDGRLFFVIPMGRRTCLGTTDTRVDSPWTEVTADDRRFILDNINRRLRLDRPLTQADVIAERCGVRPLAIAKGEKNSGDFLQMSRKHAIDMDAQRRHLSIYGGKLTDCINVGEEICERVQSLKVRLPRARYRWYGEPEGRAKEAYFRQAKRMSLDAFTPADSSEGLTTRYWRRYGAAAIELLERIQTDPKDAQVLIEGTEYTRCEIALARQREMIVKLEDFLRRRSKIALMMRRHELLAADGLQHACNALFGATARERFDEYFALDAR
ncbi:glycerol-3-phosphate dehydrogenase/oxidase [Thioalkalivibrio sp. HK1]|uniref:glycerol-3-phosphate dehydrogenase/oxidase n=1 Tax=Thioalkalivibrio sp. HK1 TaxID=1469245 RepID=UPI00046FE9DB|nr:FAD-dependent oxidoreductase [Thioalkalivibrio sp. HK1]